MTLSMIVPANPSQADRAAVLAPLAAYNLDQAGDPKSIPVAILLADADGRQVGGLWGRCVYEWLFVELVGIPQTHRGQGVGRSLMQRAEEIARQHGCRGIWLDTFEFQARGFYERLGYEVFGALDDHPPGHRRFFLRKHL